MSCKLLLRYYGDSRREYRRLTIPIAIAALPYGSANDLLVGEGLRQ